MADPRDPDVCVIATGLHIGFVHGADGLLILLGHGLWRPTTLGRITNGPSKNSQIGGCLHVDSEIQLIADFRNCEEQDSFEEQDLIGEDGYGVRLPLMCREVIDWAWDRLSGFQQSGVLQKQGIVESFRVVPVAGSVRKSGQILEITIVGVVCQSADPMAEGALHQLIGECGFS